MSSEVPQLVFSDSDDDETGDEMSSCSSKKNPGLSLGSPVHGKSLPFLETTTETCEIQSSQFSHVADFGGALEEDSQNLTQKLISSFASGKNTKGTSFALSSSKAAKSKSSFAHEVGRIKKKQQMLKSLVEGHHPMTSIKKLFAEVQEKLASLSKQAIAEKRKLKEHQQSMMSSQRDQPSMKASLLKRAKLIVQEQKCLVHLFNIQKSIAKSIKLREGRSGVLSSSQGRDQSAGSQRTFIDSKTLPGAGMSNLQPEIHHDGIVTDQEVPSIIAKSQVSALVTSLKPLQSHVELHHTHQNIPPSNKTKFPWPHEVFTSLPGCGKTALSRVLLNGKETYCYQPAPLPEYKSAGPVKEQNASNAKTIDETPSETIACAREIQSVDPLSTSKNISVSRQSSALSSSMMTLPILSECARYDTCAPSQTLAINTLEKVAPPNISDISKVLTKSVPLYDTHAQNELQRTVNCSAKSPSKRNILLELLLAGLVKPGVKCLSMNVKGKPVYGNLLSDGMIQSSDGEVFQSPEEWLYATRNIKFSKTTAWRFVKYWNTSISNLMSQLRRKSHEDHDLKIPKENGDVHVTVTSVSMTAHEMPGNRDMSSSVSFKSQTCYTSSAIASSKPSSEVQPTHVSGSVIPVSVTHEFPEGSMSATKRSIAPQLSFATDIRATSTSRTGLSSEVCTRDLTSIEPSVATSKQNIVSTGALATTVSYQVPRSIITFADNEFVPWRSVLPANFWDEKEFNKIKFDNSFLAKLGF